MKKDNGKRTAIPELDFETASPINPEKLGGQNRKIFEYLSSGKPLTVFIAITELGIYHLHSRISDLRNKCGVIIYDRMTMQNNIVCKEYSFKPF